MTVLDLIGVPFPKQAPEFATDAKILRLIKRIEDDIEIKGDLEECIASIRAVDTLLKFETELIIKIGYSEFFAVADGAVSHAVLLYAKAFNGNKRRRRLDEKKYFNSAPPLLKSAHQFFDEFRNKHFAHAEMRINEHTLHAFPMKRGQPPIAAVKSQISRTIFCRSFQWSHLQQAAQFICERLTNEIAENAEKLNAQLSPEQSSLVNSMGRQNVTSLVE